MKDTTLIEKMAHEVHGIAWDNLPMNVQQKLKICLKDALECCLANKKDIRERAAIGSITSWPQKTSTLILENKKAAAEDAAFYNTVKGALTSRNDSSRTAICHPGSMVIPAVLALAEETGANGKTVLEAVLAGYETMIRLGNALQSGHVSGAFRSTSLTAAFGCAFAAARLFNLSEQKTAAAGSFACHFAGGVNEWAVAGTGEDVFQNGWGSRNGILAARLAAAGAPACRTILEGKSGLLAAFNASEGADSMKTGFEDDYKILQIMHKPIDSCFMVQASCQAASSICLEDGFCPKDISRVDIFCPVQAKNYPGCDNTEITSYVQGIMSIQLGTASTLSAGSYEHIQWTPPFSAETNDILKKCTVYEDKEMTRNFPALQGSMVRVTMNDGRIYQKLQKDVRPLTQAEVESRFKNTALFALGSPKAEKLGEKLDRLENEKDIVSIMALMA